MRRLALEDKAEERGSEKGNEKQGVDPGHGGGDAVARPAREHIVREEQLDERGKRVLGLAGESGAMHKGAGSVEVGGIGVEVGGRGEHLCEHCDTWPSRWKAGSTLSTARADDTSNQNATTEVEVG